MEIKPFKKIPLIKYFQHDLEKIKMAHRLSASILKDLSNIRAAGDEVELTVKDFYYRKLFPKYHVCDGHIVDASLKVSPQFDIIISENSKNPVLFDLSDKSELIYYETVFCFGEVKRSFYDKKIIKDYSNNIKRLKHELSREQIAPDFIESANSGFYIEEPLTKLPLRNPLLTFLFFIDTSAVSFKDLRSTFELVDNKDLPNFTVFLDSGIIINIDKALYEKGEIKINLYPEYQTKDESIWVLMDIGDSNNILIYQYMLLLEHLNNTTVSLPNLISYTTNLFDFSISNIHKL